MARPRVLISGPAPPPPGGIAAVIRTICESELAERFEFVRFDMTAQRRVIRNVFEHGLDTAMSRGLGFDAAFNLEARAKLAAFREALATRPDLVHLHSSHGFDFWLGIRMARLTRSMRIPVLLHVHGLFDVVVPEWPPLRRFCFSRALQIPDRVIVLSEGWRRWFEQHIPSERIAVLRNPVDVRRFHPREPDASRATLRLLFVGTNEPVRKGGYEILAAAPEIVRAAPQVRFVFVGADTEQLEQRRVRGTALEKYFEFVGSKNAEQIAPYFDDADLLLLPSHAEGLPIALLEGMAAGLPVVACPVNGIPEAMNEPDNGVFVPPRDPAALARAVVELIGRPALRRSMAEANRRRAEAEFDRTHFARSLAAIYDDALRAS